MSKRTDHAAEARQAIIEAGDGRNPVTAAGSNAVAHATLALVEQQRIANLIALVALRGNSAIPVAETLIESDVDGSFVRYRPDIAAALGLAEGGAE